MDIFFQNQSSYTTGKFFSHSHNIHENKQSLWIDTKYTNDDSME